MRFEPPTIAWRGQLAKLIAQAQANKPEQGERTDKLRCICGATVHYTIQANGRTRGRCSAACGATWCI